MNVWRQAVWKAEDSGQTCRERKEQDAPLAERRTGRRQSVRAVRALQGRGRKELHVPLAKRRTGWRLSVRAVRARRDRALQGRARRVAEPGSPRPCARRDTRKTLQQRKQAPRRARSAKGWRGQTVQQGAGMGRWHMRTRRWKTNKRRARSAQRCCGTKEQDAPLADGRTGQRNSVHKGRARQGRRGAKRVAEHAGRRPSVKSGTGNCLRRRKAPVGESRQTPRGAGLGRCRPRRCGPCSNDPLRCCL